MAPLSTAVMALCTTALIYIPSAILGYGILEFGPFQRLNIHFPAQFADLIDLVYGSTLDRVAEWSADRRFPGRARSATACRSN